MSADAIATVCAVIGAVLVVACVALYDARAAVGVAGGFLLAASLLYDTSRVRP